MSDTKQDIRSKDLSSMMDLLTGGLYEFTLKRFQCHQLEIEDVHFHHDSAVLLPDYEDGDGGDDTQRQRVTAFTLLAAVFNHSRENPQQKILLAGHTDTTGTRSYNLTLSRQRAQNVESLIHGERDVWAAICAAKHKVEDYQQILNWLARDWGWDCDPGEVNNHDNAGTREAVRRFKVRYNTEFAAALATTTAVDLDTWKAFFDVYQQELREVAGVDEAGMQELRNALNSVGPGSVGCGENFPIERPGVDDFESKKNRRVEVLFFDPGEEPDLLCHPDGEHCDGQKCDLYDKTCFVHNPIDVSPGLPHALRVPVFLALAYKDPAGTERPFPEGLQLAAQYPSGTSVPLRVGRNGRVHFDADKRETSFTLRFEYADAPYISAAPDGAAAPNVLVMSADAEARAAEGHKLFRLPPAAGLSNMDWAVTGAPNYAAPDFGNLSGTDSVGNPSSPARMVLDPHWQFLKFLFVDRVSKARKSIPPIFIEAFPDRDNTAGDPPIRCNWRTSPEACQCVPWIVRDGTPPNNGVLLQFRTPANTFIKSNDDGSFTLESGAEQNVPNPDRLKYYDLPPIWKSQFYYARLSNGAGQPAAKRGLFEDLAAEATTDAKPLIFCLDDIVLTDNNLHPLPFSAADRVAVFSNTFSSGTNLSDLGLYKPDTANHQPWFSQQVESTATRNYIADYPFWTRMVVYKGNIHDVFDKRMPDSADTVVGARCAVRWVDATAAPNYVAIGSDFAAGSRPALFMSPFFHIQPFYEQRHDAWYTNTIGDDRGTGRYDMALLRCCDLDGDDEVSICLQYFRFCFNFNSPIPPSFNPTAVPYGLTGAQANAWIETAVANIPGRWNGTDGYSVGVPLIVPKEAGGPNFKTRVFWFVQALPTAFSHFELGVFKETAANQSVRAYMSSGNGRGVLDQNDNAANTTNPNLATGWFTAAHESGHGGSMGDEYLEKWSDRSCSYYQAGISSYSPGAPFDKDSTAMMNGNVRMRARYFWHIAEWMHTITLGDLKLKLGPKNFHIPSHPNAPARSYVNWPLVDSLNAASGRGRYDLFLYPLGEDDYESHYLPSQDYDGILIVTLKMRWKFHTISYPVIYRTVDRFASIANRFNNKFRVSGTAGGKNFSKCLLFFSARFLVETLSDNAAYSTLVGVTNQAQYTTKVNNVQATSGIHFQIDTQASGASAWDPANQHHLTITLDGTEGAKMDAWFAEMLGIAPAAMNTPASYQTLARQVIPDAVVQAV